uniref:Transmembrane protein 128 n=1 Tax=Leptobrachium leishanense TaxID=445787 RepID=A0A8C5LUP8_9ANUR
MFGLYELCGCMLRLDTGAPNTRVNPTLIGVAMVTLVGVAAALLPPSQSNMAALLEDKELEGMRRRFQLQAEALLQESDPSEDEEKKKEKPLPRLNVHSVFWILAACSLTYYVDFLHVVQDVLQEGCWWFYTGSLMLAASLSVALYCMVYLEWHCGISDYDTQYPALAPIAITTFIATAVCYNVSLWSTWSFFTPVLLFTQFMGVVMLISLLG